MCVKLTWTYESYFCSPGETNWLIVATGVADCYYNVVDLPAGGAFRFRVACVNKAGQGPYSNLSEVVQLDTSGMYCFTGNLEQPCVHFRCECCLWIH